MEIFCPRIRNSKSGAKNVCFNMPSRRFCCISIGIGDREPGRLLAQVDIAEALPLKDSSSRGAVLSVSWWEGRPKKGERSLKVGWRREGGGLRRNKTYVWMHLIIGTSLGIGLAVQGEGCSL